MSNTIRPQRHVDTLDQRNGQRTDPAPSYKAHSKEVEANISKEGSREVNSRALAEQAAIQRLLNILQREQATLHLRFDGKDLADLPFPPIEGNRFALSPVTGGGCLYGYMTYYSISGYHHYGTRFWYRASPDAALRELHDWQALVEILLYEIADTSSTDVHANGRELLLSIGNSIDKTARYITWQVQQPRWDRSEEAWVRIRGAEQALLFGHPFHPTPKSSSGLSVQDLHHYAPELGAHFTLHYFALAPHLVQDQSVDALWHEDIIPTVVQEEAALQLSPDCQHYRLLPCHPWQATFLLKQPVVQTLIASNELVYCGPLGPSVYPTSSVRTVCDPEHHTLYKLPLHIRITNFVRTNPVEQLQRSFDAGKILQDLQDRWPYSHFRIVLERGYRSPFTPSLTQSEQDFLIENMAVIFRQQPECKKGETPLVIATLLEPSVDGQEPALLRAIRTIEGGHISPALLEDWLRFYLDISMVPLLWLFHDYGISLEAHVQNTLLHLNSGWPGTFYVRDMEGVSISRECVQQQEHLAPDSPVLLDDEEAWQRLQYYFFTNHLSHLIATLARYGEHDELALWAIVRARLVHEQQLRSSSYIEDLLTQPTLPAKANLLSHLQERSEHPLYVTIPNLIYQSNREVAR